MRRTGWIVAALAGAVLLPSPASAADTVLTADPAHGPAAQAVTFTFRYTGVRCRGGAVLLWWDSSPIGTGEMDGTCTARMTVTAPSGAPAGPHTVTAWSMSGSAQTTFTVDAAPLGPPSPSPSSSPPLPSPSPPLPSPSASPSPSPAPTPTKPKPSNTPPASPSAPLPTPSDSSEPAEPSFPGPAGPCDPAGVPATAVNGEIGIQLSAPLFDDPVMVRAVEPARILPPAVDLTGDPQVRLTVATLPDPTPVNDAIATGRPVGCFHLDLPAGDGYRWASYAFRDVVLVAYDSGSPTAVLTFDYGGVAWRYVRTSGEVVTGDSTAPPRPAHPDAAGWLLPGAGAVLVLIGAGIWWRARRTSHVGTRRA